MSVSKGTKVIFSSITNGQKMFCTLIKEENTIFIPLQINRFFLIPDTSARVAHVVKDASFMKLTINVILFISYLLKCIYRN